MITVKLSTYDDSPTIEADFFRHTPHLSGRRGDVQFFINKKIDTCDYWVVFDSLPEADSVQCPKENTLFITGEPSSIKKYNQKFLSQFSKVITCQRDIKHPNPYFMASGHTWRANKSYDELKGNNIVEKTKLLSIVTSNKSGTVGHKKRLQFCLDLKEYFGDKVDLFGRGIRDFDDKWDVLSPYKYSIAIENHFEPDNMSEKIGDCFTALTFPFYYGCPNVSDYYDPDAYAVIDINDFEKSRKTIEMILDDKDHYARHLQSLITAKNAYLDKYNLLSFIATFVENHSDAIGSPAQNIVMRPEIEFQRKSFILKKIRTYLAPVASIFHSFT